jgi:hypothetical protein
MEEKCKFEQFMELQSDQPKKQHVFLSGSSHDAQCPCNSDKFDNRRNKWDDLFIYFSDGDKSIL